ncbi:B-cell linker protein isoform X3 [Xyrichtys novacula]|uniref:B-cell linker protein isoform X3 n=1 Tax=Xyrichtys novacula TaxID=13765 RepID=A0AAV1G199_XYRNO|nr:B-cell linker protein isoform X3 [Xyrichtys novacula]
MNLPTREECEGWDQAQVAFFMCKNKMSDCAAVVNKHKINGQRLLNLSDSVLFKFSPIHQPQLQKIVQDIKKNDGSLLDKIKRLKSKPVPKVPARDYRADDSEDQMSDPDYDNDTYENPNEEHDDSYMPPPSQRDFIPNPSASFPRGEYLDNCHNRPERPPKNPHRPDKSSKQLPPEPPHMESDEDDYISPDGGNDDDNYVEPEESSPPNRGPQGGRRTGRNPHIKHSPLPARPPSPGVYIAPHEEESSSHLSGGRLGSSHVKHSPSLPPKPSPRITVKSPVAVQETAGGDEYEVCDPEDSPSKKPVECPPKPLPKPSPRERSQRPPLKPRPDLKPREFESRTLPNVMQTEPKPQPKTFSLDLKRPKIPLPQLTPSKAATRGSDLAEDESANQDKNSDLNRKPWYANTCDRKTSYEVLYQSNKDGAFMVRKSSGQDSQQPYTLVVFYKGRVYNIPIRLILGTPHAQYALGSEKRGEEYFSSVTHIIENHQRVPLVLIDSQNNSKDSTKLCHPVKP